MKKMKRFLTSLLISTATIFGVVSCTWNTDPKPIVDTDPVVLVEDNESIDAGEITIKEVDGVREAEVNITIHEDYEFDDIDNYDGDYDYTQKGNKVAIILHSVEGDVRLRILTHNTKKPTPDNPNPPKPPVDPTEPGKVEDVIERYDITPLGPSISGGDKYTDNLTSGGNSRIVYVQKGYELLDYNDNSLHYFNLGMDESSQRSMICFTTTKNFVPSAKLTFVETGLTPGNYNNSSALTDTEINDILPPEINKESFVFYYANGGKIKGNYFEGSGYYKRIDMDHHLRPNSDIGTDIFYRDGYHLESWNTKADGSGTRIGLGSRFTSDNKNIILYAQWIKENDVSNFTFEDTETGVILKGINGSISYTNLVLPNSINGKNVVSISSDFLSDKNINKLYLPLSLKSANENAFKSCTINELHFYEGVDLKDNCFAGGKVKKVYINATLAPTKMTLEHTRLADGIDRILLNSTKKNMIFFGGCAYAYGLRSDLMEQEYSDYYITNLGVIGGSNAGFQFDILSKITRSGDIIIHAPEEMSEYQLMASNNAEERIFQNAEANYDLLTYVDVDEIPKFFDVYRGYLLTKSSEPAQRYSNYCANYNEYGDIVPEVLVSVNGNIRRRDEQGLANKSYARADEDSFRPDFVTKDSMEMLAHYYDKLKANNVKCLFSFSPLNQAAFSEEQISDKVWLQFENNVKKYLTSYPVISKAETYVYDSIYFFDEDYHMTYEGATLRTESLIEDINAYFNNK